MKDMVKARIREATVSDIPLLAIHHRKMFEEIWEKNGEDIDIANHKGSGG